MEETVKSILLDEIQQPPAFPYQKEKLIGRGAYGKVYLVRDEENNLLVMKVMHSDDNVD